MSGERLVSGSLYLEGGSPYIPTLLEISEEDKRASVGMLTEIETKGLADCPMCFHVGNVEVAKSPTKLEPSGRDLRLEYYLCCVNHAWAFVLNGIDEKKRYWRPEPAKPGTKIRPSRIEDNVLLIRLTYRKSSGGRWSSRAVASAAPYEFLCRRLCDPANNLGKQAREAMDMLESHLEHRTMAELMAGREVTL